MSHTARVRPVVIAGDPVLHNPTRPVEIGDDGASADVRALIDDMFATMDAAHGVGLAANQVGEGLRVFVYSCPDPDTEGMPTRRGYVINPTLETSEVPETMPDEDEDEEGCLSVPGYSYPTNRASWARVCGVDADGTPVTVEGTGFFARCLQHEVGHLNGLLYTDVLTGRWSRMARKAIKAEKWTEAGNTWMPGVDPDPFGHDDE